MILGMACRSLSFDKAPLECLKKRKKVCNCGKQIVPNCAVTGIYLPQNSKNQNLSSLVFFEILKILGSDVVVHVYSPIPLEAEGGGLKVPNQPELCNVSPY